MIDKPKNVDNANEVVLNNQKYTVTFFIVNSNSLLPIPVQSVISLSVTENIYSIFPHLVLTLDNTGNFIENTVQDTTTVLRERIQTQTFDFNLDGSDTFYISVVPAFDNTPGSKNSDLLDESLNVGDSSLSRMGFEGFFSIYDEDESVLGKSSTKQKMFSSPIKISGP